MLIIYSCSGLQFAQLEYPQHRIYKQTYIQWFWRFPDCCGHQSKKKAIFVNRIQFRTFEYSQTRITDKLIFVFPIVRWFPSISPKISPRSQDDIWSILNNFSIPVRSGGVDVKKSLTKFVFLVLLAPFSFLGYKTLFASSFSLMRGNGVNEGLLVIWRHRAQWVQWVAEVSK